jgi:hypothetical protein
VDNTHNYDRYKYIDHILVLQLRNTVCSNEETLKGSLICAGMWTGLRVIVVHS